MRISNAQRKTARYREKEFMFGQDKSVAYFIFWLLFLLTTICRYSV